MAEPLLAPTFLFRFSVPCYYHGHAGEAGADLDERYVIPSFCELDGRRVFADVRAAWSERGLVFCVRVGGKSRAPWCRHTRLEESDGLHVWIDTRDTHTVHRPTRFCHRFAFLPSGSGSRYERPTAAAVPLEWYGSAPSPARTARPQLTSRTARDGYQLHAVIPATALAGYDPHEHPRLGFFYAVRDQELGWQTFSVGPEFPFEYDPSLWGTLELVRQ